MIAIVVTIVTNFPIAICWLHSSGEKQPRETDLIKMLPAYSVDDLLSATHMDAVDALRALFILAACTVCP